MGRINIQVQSRSPSLHALASVFLNYENKCSEQYNSGYGSDFIVLCVLSGEFRVQTWSIHVPTTTTVLFLQETVSLNSWPQVHVSLTQVINRNAQGADVGSLTTCFFSSLVAQRYRVLGSDSVNSGSLGSRHSSSLEPLASAVLLLVSLIPVLSLHGDTKYRIISCYGYLRLANKELEDNAEVLTVLRPINAAGSHPLIMKPSDSSWWRQGMWLASQYLAESV